MHVDKDHIERQSSSSDKPRTGNEDAGRCSDTTRDMRTQSSNIWPSSARSRKSSTRQDHCLDRGRKVYKRNLQAVKRQERIC
jgi:hypothetical protein